MEKRRYRSLVGLSLVAAISGCAQVKQYSPQPVQAQYTLSGLPASIVRVEVVDMRAERRDSAQLVQAVKHQLQVALSQRAAQHTHGLYTLEVDIIEHRSYFTLGNWNASTRFHVKLKNPQGTVLESWDADGSAHRSNMWGYSTANAVSQDAYNLAIANMMADLSDAVIGRDQ